MPTVNEVRVSARSPEGAVCKFHLRIALLPRGNEAIPAALLDGSSDTSVDDSLAPIQLLEGHEYQYQWEHLSESVTAVVTDPEEAFQPDTSAGLRGRLRPGLATGTMQVTLRSGGDTLGQLELEVRSRKLHYLSEYRWMLRDIADQMTELLMERFAVSGMTFTQEDTRDAVTLYQRFAFLRALITSESFQVSLSEITRRPHVAWMERHETVAPGQALRAGAHTIRQLSRPGARAPWPDGPIDSVPLRLDQVRTEASHDTTPNRFVRFALERWRQVVADIDRGLAAHSANAAVARGRREVAQTLEQLDAILHHDLFKNLGPLMRFPAENQVLQRREGYRDVFRAYLEFELAARLSWKGSESSYAAGQRDVATLYEYWAFLQLAKLVGQLVGQSFDMKPLLETRSDGLNVVLQAGKETVLSGFAERLGRTMTVELCFNRTFSRTTDGFGAWTRAMRPDYSIIIKAPPNEPAAFEPVVLHFDAKYRVNLITELFGQRDDVADTNGSSPLEVRRSGARRDDLLKMHAYRDAIHQSAGAYVLYPGDDDPSNSIFREYRELLPGLGAFILRPSQRGDASGIATLRVFLDQILDHLATRMTRHERGRYWLDEVYRPYELTNAARWSMTSNHPAPETIILLGYVKSSAHWNWIQQHKTYNVRTEERAGGIAANSQLLYSQLLLLYCPGTHNVALARIVSDPELVRKQAMKSTGYPNPSSDYLCVQLSWLSSEECISLLSAAEIDQLVQRLGKRRGEPTAVSWAHLKKMNPH